MLKTFGIAAPSKAFPRLQEALQFPTLNVRGLVSAHVGAGARTIIPDRATAAMDIRLVKETPPRASSTSCAPTSARRAITSSKASLQMPTAPRTRSWPRLVSESPTNAFRTSPSDPQVKRIVAA